MMFMLMLMMMAAATEAGRSRQRSRGVTSGACGGVGSGGKRVKAADKRDALLGKQYSGSKVEKKENEVMKNKLGSFEFITKKKNILLKSNLHFRNLISKRRYRSIDSIVKYALLSNQSRNLRFSALIQLNNNRFYLQT